MGKVPRKRGFLKTIDKILCLAYNNIIVKAIDLVGKLDPGDVNKLLAFFFIQIENSFFVCVTRYKCIKIFSSVNACDNICLYFEVVHITRTVLRRCSSVLNKKRDKGGAGEQKCAGACGGAAFVIK